MTTDGSVDFPVLSLPDCMTPEHMKYDIDGSC